VNIGETTDWPGRETDPAFALPPSRDFDGGLLRRWSYHLTAADALALLRLRKPWSNLHKVGFGLASVTGGALSTLYPTVFLGLGPFLMIETLLITGFFAGRGLLRRRAARAMVPTPRTAVFEEWIDCIAATSIDGTDEDYLSPELIGEVLQTRSHIFVRSHSTTLVIPTRAFATASEAAELAVHLRNLAKGPYYFDP
jgi:hypothetical protein